jgi:hypothetical protein
MRRSLFLTGEGPEYGLRTTQSSFNCRSSSNEAQSDKPWFAAVLGFVLELGNFPVSSRSVRHHHTAVDLRKRPVGCRPVPSFLGPRAIPNPFVACPCS